MQRMPHNASARTRSLSHPSQLGLGTLRFVNGLLATCMLSVNSGCTMTINTRFKTPQYASVEPPSDLAIDLRITEPFRGYVWRQSDALGLEPMAMPLKGVLADNALAAARAAFRRVTLEEPGAIAPSSSGRIRQGVLIPQVASIRTLPPSTRGRLVWSDVEQIVSIEWTLKTPEGVIAWVGTATGRFTNKNGNTWTFKGKMRERLREAVDNAFANSVKLMADSREIRQYADTRNALRSQ